MKSCLYICKDTPKNVQISQAVIIITIPNTHHIANEELWYTKDEYKLFQNEAYNELYTIHNNRPRMTMKLAKILLWQPTNYR